MSLSDDLRNVLTAKGAQLVGFGSLQGVDGCDFPVGVCVALAVPAEILEDIKDGPTLAYLEMYNAWNSRLNEIVTAGEEFLIERGFRAFARTTDKCTYGDDFLTPLPHKTIATRAALGWIGKSDLLVTPQFGPAVRISTLLTDAPLDCAEAIVHSKCGTCDICQKACPAQAIYGTLWNASTATGTATPRQEIVDTCACSKKMREITTSRIGKPLDICGKCFVVCPYTKNRLDH